MSIEPFDPNIEYPLGFLDSGVDESILAVEVGEDSDTESDFTFAEDPTVTELEVPTTDPATWVQVIRIDGSGRSVVDLYVDLDDVDRISYEYQLAI